MVVTFLFGAAGTIQFCGMIFSKAPRASLSNQSPGVLMARHEWHSAMTAFSMWPSQFKGEILRYGSADGRPHGKPFVKDLG